MAATNSSDGACRYMDDALMEPDALTQEELIVHVLRGAHRMAQELDAPDDARAVLHVAHAFAKELDATNPDFDRARFVRIATGGPVDP